MRVQNWNQGIIIQFGRQAAAAENNNINADWLTDTQSTYNNKADKRAAKSWITELE